jgi:asparagine synthase (glutamine-hydrolysing)
MCGLIALYFNGDMDVSQAVAASALKSSDKMLDMLRKRGPDECNLVQVGSAFLGHTRLSIIDLQTGSQPIYNEDKTVAVLLNGEIYNFHELRSELEKHGHRFQSASDTEVIVHLYEECGEDVFSKTEWDVCHCYL